MNAPGEAGVTIRLAAGADLPALTRLCGEFGYVSSEAQVAARFERILADHEQGVYAAEDAAGRVIGWVQVQRTKLLESDMRAEIVGLVVAEAMRRRRIGERLVRAAEAWAKAHGCPLVSVRCNQTRAEAHAFYRRLGYSVTKTQLNFRKPL